MPRNLRKRGDIWWFRITKNGAAHEGSLQTANLSLAKERLERIRQELTATRFGDSRPAPDRAQMFDAVKPVE